MIDKSGFGQKYKPLAERRAQLDDQIPAIQAEIDVMRIAYLSQESALEESRDLHNRWPTLPKEEKRRIVEAIVERITIGDGEVDIILYYTPPPPLKSGGGGSTSNQGGKPPSSPNGSENRGNLATQRQGCSWQHKHGQQRCCDHPADHRRRDLLHHLAARSRTNE